MGILFLESLATALNDYCSDERLEGPQTLSLLKTDLSKPNPKSGAVQLEWNKTGTLLLVRYGNDSCFYGDRVLITRTDNVPNGVHIYDFPTPSEPFVPRLRCVLVHLKPVMHARWNPMRKGSLVICCGTQSVFTWSDEWVGEGGDEEDMAECIGVPASSEWSVYR